MFQWLEGKVARAAPAVDLDVGGLVGAVGHVVVGEVGDAEEKVAQRGGGRGGVGFEAGDLVLLVGDEGAEPFELGLVAPGLGGAHGLAGGVALGEGGFGGSDAGAAGLVEGENLGGGGWQAAAGEGGVEGEGFVADLADVVHFGPRKRAGRVMADKGREGKDFRDGEGVWNPYGNRMGFGGSGTDRLPVLC